MRFRWGLGAATVVATLALHGVALADSAGTVAGLRAQVERLITAELQKDTSTVCAIVGNDGTIDGKTCEQRWDRSLKHFFRHGGRHLLHLDMAAVPSAAVTSTGYSASITLPHPLLDGQSNFSWYDNCWMLMK